MHMFTMRPTSGIGLPGTRELDGKVVSTGKGRKFEAPKREVKRITGTGTAERKVHYKRTSPRKKVVEWNGKRYRVHPNVI